MGDPQPLSVATLRRLEETLRLVGAPEALDASPGLPLAEIGTQLADLPGVVPAELELWFSWCTWGDGGYYMLPALRYHTLAGCLAWYHHELQVARDLEPIRREASLDPVWRREWFPLSYLDGGVHLVVDLRGSDGRIAPVREIYGQGVGEEFDRLQAGSLGDYVTAALDEIDAGARVYDRDAACWRAATPRPA